MCSIFCLFGCLTLCGCRDRVARHLVFFPPQEESYSTIQQQQQQIMCVHTQEGNTVSRQIYQADTVKFESVRVSRGRSVSSVWLSCVGSNTTLLYSHGNATDLGYLCSHLLSLSVALKVNIFAYDYEGYGLSTGKPSAQRCIDDISSCYSHLLQHYPTQAERVIGYGQSLGTGPTIKLATVQPLNGLILHSPLTSCVRVINPHLTHTPFYDLFPNIDLITKTINQPPIFILHGAEDTEIPVEHATQLYEKLTTSAEGARQVYPMWLVKSAGHNDIELQDTKEYIRQIRAFITYVENNTPPLNIIRDQIQTNKQKGSKKTNKQALNQ